MKKGDLVYVKNELHECGYLAMFDHEHDGMYYTELNGNIYRWIYCEPYRKTLIQTFGEWHEQWFKDRFGTETIDLADLSKITIAVEYYEARKKWEESNGKP